MRSCPPVARMVVFALMACIWPVFISMPVNPVATLFCVWMDVANHSS